MFSRVSNFGLFSFVTFLFLLFFFSTSFAAPLGGTYTVGSGGTFTTIAAAISALNGIGVGAPVIFSLTDPTYSETGANLRIAVSSNAPTSTNTVTFKPASGVSPIVTITGCDATNKAGFMIDGTSYITVDGSNSVGGTTKDLTFRMNDGINGLYGIAVQGNSDNVIIKNCKFSYQVAPPNGSYGIRYYSNNAAGIQNGLVDNVQVGTNSTSLVSNYGVAFRATSTNPIENCILSNSIVYALQYGVYVNGFGTVASGTMSISGTQINIVDYSSGAGYAVYLSNYLGTINITTNRIHNFSNSSSAVVSLISGTGLTSQTNVNITNNFCGGNITTGSSITGLHFLRWLDAGNSNVSITHNTFKLNTLNVSLPSSQISSIIDLTNGAISIKNNIFINERNGANDYLIRNAGTATIDYNNFVGASSQTGNRGTNASTSSMFLTSATDFHLTGASIGDQTLSGTSGTGITTDIDGQTRHATKPYMGADENTDSPLPVELISFSGTRVGNSVELTWVSATEVDAYSYDVEQSRDNGSNFTLLGSVHARGNANAGNRYSFTIDNAASSACLYRLKMVDLSGRFEYSDVISVESVENPTHFALEQNFPNPFNPATSISFSIPSQQNVNLTVFSALGEEVAVLANEVFEAGVHSLSFDATNLPSGIYWYSLTTGSFSQTKKMVLMK